MKTAKMSLMARMKMKKADPKKKPMTVEGQAARPRLDRPGRMKRAEGGPTISEGSKKEAARLREGAKTDANFALGHGAVGLLNTAGAAASAKRLPGFAIGNLAGGIWNANEMRKSGNAADKKLAAASRLEKGQAPDDGKEDRAKGGRVKK